MKEISWKVNLSICKFYNKILTILFEFDYVLFDISIYLLGIESIIEKVLKQPADEVTFNKIVTFCVFISFLYLWLMSDIPKVVVSLLSPKFQ